jgi:hypothetical protein
MQAVTHPERSVMMTWRTEGHCSQGSQASLGDFDQLPARGPLGPGKCILAGRLVEMPPFSGPKFRSAGRRPFHKFLNFGPSALEFRPVDELASPDCSGHDGRLPAAAQASRPQVAQHSAVLACAAPSAGLCHHGTVAPVFTNDDGVACDVLVQYGRGCACYLINLRQCNCQLTIGF